MKAKTTNRTDYKNFIISLSSDFYAAMIDYLNDSEIWSDYLDGSKMIFGYGYI